MAVCTKTEPVLLLLFSLSLGFSIAFAAQGAEWRRLETWSCIDESLAARVFANIRSAMECSLSLNTLTGSRLFQLNPTTGKCVAFVYESVCGSVPSVSASGADDTCVAYADQRSFVSLRLHQSLGHKLTGAWLMNQDGDASVRNAACGTSHRWLAENVEFVSDGEKFNGVTSKMTLEEADFGDLYLSLTWLIRLRRQPLFRGSFLENFGCSAGTVGLNFVEWPAALKFSFGTANQFTPSRITYANRELLESDPNRFFNLAVVARPISEDYKLYYNEAFLTDVTTEPNAWNTHQPDYRCFTVGYRKEAGYGFLQGVVAAVGFSNATMTLEEIDEFFRIVQ